ncbi:MAG TPA: chloride channel protein [Ignavibacteriaceae bacterium]|nr:chloride channel protein [Ignavibacteriaceae bacterium]
MLKRLIVRLAKWRTRFIPDKIFLIVASIIIGVLAGLAAVALKTTVHFIQEILHSSFKDQYNTYLYFVYPLIGIFLSTLFVQYFLKGRLHRGIGNVIIEISNKKGIIARHKLYSQFVTSIFTLGFGGSAGLEAPISVTGAAIGSNTATTLRIGEKERKLLLGCGAAAGIAAIFNSPIAGVLFAIEILISELAVASFIPLLISSASATVVSKVLYTGQPFKLITNAWELNSLIYYILLGLVCALISIYIIRVYTGIHKLYSKWNSPYLKALTGGLALGGLLYVFPSLFGEGYNIVESILDGNYLILFDRSIFWEYRDSIGFLLLYGFIILMVKVIATSITVNSGGNGGMFGSSLFIGALLGFVYARVINVSGIHHVIEVNFIVVAMAGILAGVIHSPLTAIFLIAEITGGYALFIPLMVVVALSYFITIYFEPFSIYTKDIAEKGEFILYDRDRMILENLQLSKMIEKDFTSLNEQDTLSKLIEVIGRSHRNIFPILDNEANLVGIISLDDVREIIFEKDLYHLILMKDIMSKPPAVIDLKDKMYNIVKKIDELNLWNLPVVKDGKYVGFISKSNVLSHYRNLLLRQTST